MTRLLLAIAALSMGTIMTTAATSVTLAQTSIPLARAFA